MKFTLGERVVVSRTLARRWTDIGNIVWHPVQLPEPVEGIVTGTRTLSNGVWHTDVTEDGLPEGSYYSATEYLQAVHVVVHLRQKPLIVPLDGITRIN